MVDLDAAVRVAHELEDVFVAAQEGSLVLLPEHVDTLLRGVICYQPGSPKRQTITSKMRNRKP